MRTQKNRGVRVRTLIISLALAILLLILDNIFAVSDSFLSLILPPRGEPAVTDGFYFQVSPSWGTVTLDGHPITHLPDLGTESPLQLQKGTHKVVWQTTPFPIMTCLLHIPLVQDSQACPVRTITHPNPFTSSAFVVTPPQTFSLRLLPQAQQQALIAAIQQRLDTLQSTDVVQPGEAYRPVMNEASVKIASQPLQASLRFLLDTDTSRQAHCQGMTLSQSNDPPCFIAQHDCRLFCTLAWATDSTDVQPQWDIAAIVRPLRTYAPSGEHASSQEEVGDTQQFVTFRISWDQKGWHASFHRQGDSAFDDPNCYDLMSLFVTDPHYQSVPQSHWNYISGSNRAQGCVAAMQPDEATRASSSPDEPILFERFGILLAANDAASQQWPDIAKASAYERQLAEEIVRHPVFVS